MRIFCTHCSLYITRVILYKPDCFLLFAYIMNFIYIVFMWFGTFVFFGLCTAVGVSDCSLINLNVC